MKVEYIPGLEDGSVLYISATVASEHPLHPYIRSRIDLLPDIDLGRIVQSAGSWSRRYFAPRVVDATRGKEELPQNLAAFRGIVIGGSIHRWLPQREQLAAWQEDLILFVQRAIVNENLPFLGLCGGAQIACLALGGIVRPNPADLFPLHRKEGKLLVRTSKVELTAAGRRDKIFVGCGSELEMQEAHHDWLAEIPPGCEVLARTKDLANTVIAWEDRVRLFLTHPEMSLDLLRRLVGTVAETSHDDETRAALLAALPGLRPTPEANARVVANFLTHFCAKHARA